ncbi:MAG TPA: right-handed parallel beta-helix repeat-containing protein [Thermoplasmata archaeon]|nr:right-handed parallel beta-helix repeat-containing protein [Thermoplasmata archaeon]
MRRSTAILGAGLIAALMLLSPSGLSHVGGSPRATSSLVADLAKPSVFTGVVIILPNGTVTPGGAPISQVGNTYALTAGFAGRIIDQRNGSTLNGAGLTLTTTPGGSIAVTVQGATSVTVTGLTIANDSSIGVYVTASNSVAITSDSATGKGFAVYADSVAGLNVSNDLFGSTGGIYVEYGTDLLVASNALAHSIEGVYVSEVVGVVIRNNNISFVTGAALDVEYSTNIQISQNSMYNLVTYNKDQMYLEDDKDLTVTWNNGSAGEYLVYGEYLSATYIANNHFPGVLYSGFYVEYSTNLTIDRNYIPHTGTYAFYGYGLTGFAFTNNQADHAGSDAVYVEYATNGVISHNNLSYFRDGGVNPEYSSNLSITSNQMSYAVSTAGDGIYTYEDGQLLIASNNASHDEYGWFDDESFGVVVTGNDFSHANGSGDAIYAEYDGGLTISNVQGSYCYYGLYLYYASGVTVRNSNFDHTASEAVYAYESTSIALTNIGANASADYAVDLEYSTDLALSNVWAAVATSYTVYLYEDQGVTIAGVDAAQGNYGLYAWYVTSLTVVSSNFSQDHYGMYLYYSSGLTISDNSFWLDNYSFDYESNNAGVVYHNNFINDRAWIVSSPPTTSFAWANGYPQGGNYWSNYTGLDTKSGPGQNLPGADRIGDTPYALNPVTADPYPLMGAWVSHTLTFTETGLASGVGWSVSVDGRSASTNTNALVFLQADGAIAPFQYAVATVPGYHVSPASGSGTESGANLAIGLVFTPVNYTVTFTAAGVAPTSVWSVTINGHTTTATGPSLTVNEPNGTFTYTVVKGSDYSITPSPGSFTVVGAPMTIALTAKEILYNLTFSESGLSSGTSWSVTVNGVTKSSTSATIVFQEPNGSYSYSVGSVNGYSVTPAHGTASVAGGAAVFAAAYANSGLTGTALALLVGLVLVLIAAIAGWVMYMRARKPKPPTPMTGAVPAWSEGPPSAPAPSGPTPPPSP